MKERKTTPFSRLLAALLATVLLIGMLPLSALPVYAEDDVIPDSGVPASIGEEPNANNGVAINVRDENGNAISGVKVTYTITRTYETEEGPVTEDYADNAVAYTNNQGRIIIIEKNDYPDGELTLSASAEITGWDYSNDSGEIVDKPILSSTDDFIFTMRIADNTVSPITTLVYDKTEQELVTVNALQGDTVQYKVNHDEQWSYQPAKGKDVGEYAVEVKVQRRNVSRIFVFDDGENCDGPKIKIRQAPLDITVTCEAVDYTGAPISLIDSIDGLEDGDQLTISYNNSDYHSIEQCPMVTDVGRYPFTVSVVRSDNYEVYSDTFARIIKAVPISGLSVKLYTGENGENPVYDGNEHPPVEDVLKDGISIKDNPDYTIKYHQAVKNDSKPTEWSEEGWVDTLDELEKIKNAGTYWTAVLVTPKVPGPNYTEETVLLCNPITINKAEQNLSFVNPNISEVITFTERGQTFDDFECTVDTDNEIIYSIECSYQGVATIDSTTGTVTVYSLGIFTVFAKCNATENYEEATINTPSIYVKPAESQSLIQFDTDEVEYELETTGKASSLKAKTLFDYYSYSLSYRLSNTNLGLKIDSNSGKVTVDNWKTLHDNMRSSGSITLTVYADYRCDFGFGGDQYFGDRADYRLTVRYHKDIYENGSNPVNASQNDTKTHWYNFDNPAYVEVASVTGEDGSTSIPYSISTDPNPGSSSYGSTVPIRDQLKEGESRNYPIYIKDSAANNKATIYYVYEPTSFDFTKIDYDPPIINEDNVSVTYYDYCQINEILSKTFFFYNPISDNNLRVSINATDPSVDEISGPYSVHWYYNWEDDDVSADNVENAEGTVGFIQGIATIKLPQKSDGSDAYLQYRGRLSYRMTDAAGNTTTEPVNDEGNIVIIDTINPKCTIEYTDATLMSSARDTETGKIKRYFSAPVTAELHVIENNFWPEDFYFYVSKDGNTQQKITLHEWYKDSDGKHADNDYSISSEGNGSNGPTGDGDYVVYAGYKDRSGNIGDFSDSLQDRSPEPDLPALPEFDYVSDIITIDKTNPELSFDYKADDQIVDFTVIERNFSSGGFTFDEFTIQDLRGEPIEGSEDAIAYLKSLLNDASRWSTETDENGKSVDDEYRISLSAAENAEIPDGIYHIVLRYKDPAGHVSESKTVEFTFDRTPPTGIKIEFSEDLDYPDGKIKGYKFYNPTVDVTFTATDLYSGVKAFTWGYTKQDGASTTNHPGRLGDTVEAYVRNPDEDGAVFTATVRLPLEAAQQLRGSFNVKAADAKDNISETIQDNTVIVVDTVKPTIGVQYSPYSNEVGKTSYYGIDKDGQVQVKMTITEANFFEGDVKVSITKDGAPYTTPAINWSSVGSDKHEGTFTLGGKNNIYDGLYKINVTYTDRSGNVMDAYNSDPIVLDYTKPVITVTYQNRNGNTMRDANGNNRTYFNQPQTATVTIVERNFNADDVRFAFTAKDVTGANLANPTPSNWTSSGDTHTCTISYPGDANYSFDVDYTDLATNAADDYAPDYFTVDKTAPRITGITYSPSSSRYSNDKIGYYDRQMTVTVTVEDDTSGVNSFLHNYGDGASNISMSNDGKTATITFNIPTGALGANNQFNGTVKFSVIDRSGNKTDGETKTIVADNIKPVMSVSYSPAKKESAADHDYYDGPVTVTVSIDEANFFPEDFQLVLDGQSFTINNWSSANGKHTGSFVIQQDGEHSFTIDYADRSGNKMKPYASNVVTVDTKLDAPRFTINGSSITSTDPNDPSLYLGGAYSDAAKVGFSFGDENFKSYKITLTQTNYSMKNDVTDPFVKSVILPADSLAEPGEKSFEALFDIPKKLENDGINLLTTDGIYLLTIEMTDKAGHSVTSTLKFTINRYGSVYEYSDDLLALIENGGAHVQVVDGNIYIEEYNASEVENGSIHILVTRDGVPVELTPQIDTVNINGVAWHHYIYTIPNSAFAADGYYQITISSTDKDGNTSTSVPENLISRHADGTLYRDTMSFTVDTIPPEIRSIVNLEKPIADRDKIVDGKLPVTYTLVDVGGLASFEVWLDGKRIDVDCVGWNPDSNDPKNHYFANLFGEDLHYYTGTFYIPESSEIQHVRIKATDLAGNWTDTDKGYSNEPDKEFTTDLFEFNKDITVSTNALVRWYRNTPVFWGTIGGAGVLGSGFGFLFAKKRKKDEEEVVPEGEQKA